LGHLGWREHLAVGLPGTAAVAVPVAFPAGPQPAVLGAALGVRVTALWEKVRLALRAVRAGWDPTVPGWSWASSPGSGWTVERRGLGRRERNAATRA
jgi:hypothetical protein